MAGRAVSFLGRTGSLSFNDRTIRDNLASDEPELSLPDNQFGPITVFIERGRDALPIQICFSAPLLLADAKCG